MLYSRAMLLSCVLAVALPAAANAYEAARLPVRVSLAGEGPVCGSKEMRQNLKARFWHPVDVKEAADLRLECTQDASGATLAVGYAGKETRVRVSREEASSPPVVAYVLMSRAAKNREVIDAALDAYFAWNAKLGALGSEDFADARWPDAQRHLAAALESDLNEAPLYFGLYKASAETGHPLAAKWYLLAYLKAAGRAPADLTREQGLPLIKAEATKDAREDEKSGDAAFVEYQRYAGAHRWNSAMMKLHEVIEKAPWYEPAYVNLAQTYDVAGWKRLTKLWRKRAIFVRALNMDAQLGKDVEARLDALASSAR